MTKKLDWFDNIEDRPHSWPGVMWLTTMIAVPDVAQAITLYTETFGLVSIFELPGEDTTIILGRLRYRGCNIALYLEGTEYLPSQSPVTSGAPAPSLFYLYVDNVDEAFKKAISAGCEEITSPNLAFWGDRIARIKDPFGYIWELATRVA